MAGGIQPGIDGFFVTNVVSLLDVEGLQIAITWTKLC